MAEFLSASSAPYGQGRKLLEAVEIKARVLTQHVAIMREDERKKIMEADWTSAKMIIKKIARNCAARQQTQTKKAKKESPNAHPPLR